ncbi:hypothetical protein BC828DRAFT_372520 [Blastocladiella britannica]|nr:hypothetical protein BC828DRAFT_372520 [Blastocladiella britannica]
MLAYPLLPPSPPATAASSRRASAASADTLPMSDADPSENLLSIHPSSPPASPPRDVIEAVQPEQETPVIVKPPLPCTSTWTSGPPVLVRVTQSSLRPAPPSPSHNSSSHAGNAAPESADPWMEVYAVACWSAGGHTRRIHFAPTPRNADARALARGDAVPAVTISLPPAGISGVAGRGEVRVVDAGEGGSAMVCSSARGILCEVMADLGPAVTQSAPVDKPHRKSLLLFQRRRMARRSSSTPPPVPHPLRGSADSACDDPAGGDLYDDQDQEMVRRARITVLSGRSARAPEHTLRRRSASGAATLDAPLVVRFACRNDAAVFVAVLTGEAAAADDGAADDTARFSGMNASWRRDSAIAADPAAAAAAGDGDLPWDSAYQLPPIPQLSPIWSTGSGALSSPTAAATFATASPPPTKETTLRFLVPTTFPKRSDSHTSRPVLPPATATATPPPAGLVAAADPRDTAHELRKLHAALAAVQVTQMRGSSRRGSAASSSSHMHMRARSADTGLMSNGADCWGYAPVIAGSGHRRPSDTTSATSSSSSMGGTWVAPDDWFSR